jgi:two-component system C4-dicarboxylate transport response regulator DctD
MTFSESTAPSVLYVEDDPAVRLGTTQSLQLAGFHARAFGSAEQVLAHLVAGFPGVLLTDVKLPGIDGLQLLERARQIDRDLPVMLVTGHGDISMAVEAMRLGAYDFIEKPYSPEQLCEVVGRAIEKRRLTLEVHSLKKRIEGLEGIEAKIVGKSSAMRELRRVILDIAATNADVLVVGETGTGKELVARCLHDYGKRKAGPFVALNCGGMPELLFESEVFGHEAGSFTGAAKRRIGKIEHAAGGSLFLDEIESMPPSLQVKLLRALQERKFERLGSNTLLPMDSRVIAATKTDLLRPAPETPFRADLYYRLSVVVLNIPALRERREDIPALFGHFMLQAALRYERPVPELSARRLQELMSHDWPGNVRELRNAADRMVLGLPFLEASGASGPGGTGDHRTRSLDEQMAAFERHLLEAALKAAGGRAVAASELLQIPRKTLYDKLKRFGIATDEFRTGERDAAPGEPAVK